jgi:hypothetical protein
MDWGQIIAKVYDSRDICLRRQNRMLRANAKVKP